MNSTTFSIPLSGLLLYALVVLVAHAEDIPAMDDRSLYIESETKAVSPTEGGGGTGTTQTDD